MEQIPRWLKQIGKFIFDYKFTILLMLYLCVISAMATGMLRGGCVNKPVIFNALSFILVFILLAKINNRTLSVILTAVLSVLISLDAFFAFVYKSTITMGIMASSFETNQKEAKEALVNAMLPAVIVLVVTTVLIFKSVKELRKSKVKGRYALILWLFYCIIGIPAMLGRKLYVNEVWRGSFKLHPLTTAQDLMSKHLPLLYGDILTLAAYQDEMCQFRQYSKGERVLPEGVVLNDTIDVPEKIFFIIGESSNRNHYSLYGYPIKTTPFLDSLNQANCGLKYYKGIAPATFTRDAVRIIMTFASPSDNKQPFFEEKNLIDLAREAGYETIWMSNQTKREFDGGYIGLISATADVGYYPDEPYDDLNLAHYIDSVYTPEKKQFFVMHLTGSHLTYYSRYDEADKNAIAGNDNDHKVQYNRTIHHTDRVLRIVYNIMHRDSSSVMCYMPDHSEIVGVGHGFMRDGTDQFDIPLITINRSRMPMDSIVGKYVEPDLRMVNTNSVIYIMSQLMGYSISKELTDKALADGQYVLNADGNVYRFEEIRGSCAKKQQ